MRLAGVSTALTLLALLAIAARPAEAWPERMLSESRECAMPSENVIVLWWHWFCSWFSPPLPPCDETEIFLERLFSLSTWLDSDKREDLLAELPRHLEFKSSGPQDKILEYMKKHFDALMAKIATELGERFGIDMTPYDSFLDQSAWPESRLERDVALPVVLVPGVHSSCHGMLENVVGFLQHYLNTEHVECIATDGATHKDQILSSWFSGGADAVEHFRQRVLANPIYSERGFNVVAFSQGNFITRGYVQQYNGMTIDNQVHPVVKSWVAVNGPVFGQGGIPAIDNSDWWGATLDGLAAIACGNDFLASVVTPCDYVRVPGGELVGYRDRLLAKLNGEDLGIFSSAAEREAQEQFLAQSKENINRMDSFVAVKNQADSVIKPASAQWLGAYGGSFDEVLDFQQTKFYQEDTFGFKTLHDEGKVHFVLNAGDYEHCIFSAGDVMGWVDTFWAPAAPGS